MSKYINLPIQEAEGTTNRINSKKFTSIELKLVQKTKYKKKILESSEKKHLNYRGKVIKITVAFSSETQGSATIVLSGQKSAKSRII